MFSELRLTNFMGFGGEHRARLSPITLIYGPNSSGKSALLHALTLLGQSARRAPSPRDYAEPLVFQGEWVNLADYRNVIHRHDLKSRMGLGLTHTAPPPLQPRGPQIEPEDDRGPLLSVDLEFDWSRERERCLLTSTTYAVETDDASINEVAFKLKRGARPEEDRLAVTNSPTIAAVVQNLSDLANRRYSRNPESRRYIEVTPQMARRFILRQRHHILGFLPDSIRSDEKDSELAFLLQVQWDNLVNSRRLETTRALSLMRYLGPLRSAPRRVEPRVQSGPDDVGPTGEGTAALLHEDPDSLERINGWLERMEVPYSVKTQRVTSAAHPALGNLLAILLVDRRTDTVVSTEDVGFGISQILPVITQVLASKDLVIGVEQPEIHLHPRLQAHLADLFIEATGPDHRNQIIAESHSENLLLRLQRRIREGSLDPEMVTVNYVGASQGTGSWIQQLRLGTDGEFIDEWPHGFFEERLDDWLG